MRINFDFSDLHAFLAVAELGSFQRAAETLHVSQSAVTRRIQKLEEALGVSLFERTTRSLKLTLAARLFRERAKLIVDNTQEAISAISDDVSQRDYYRNTVVTIATIQTATHEILPQLIKRFRQAGYHSRIRVLDVFANDVVDAVAQGDADFGISFMGAQEPGLSMTPMKEDPFVVAMHSDHALQAMDEIRWEDLEACRDVAIAWRGSGNRMLIDNALAKSQQRVDWAYQVRHSSTLLSLVKANVAIAILPLSAIANSDAPLIVTRPLVAPEIIRAIGKVRRTGQTLTSAAEALYRLA